MARLSARPYDGMCLLPLMVLETHMPYTFNESRRHKMPTAKYRVTDWPEYDTALASAEV
jgi:hypothetical protein